MPTFLSMVIWTLINALLCAGLIGFSILIYTHPRKEVTLKKGIRFINHGVLVKQKTTITNNVSTSGGVALSNGTVTVGGVITQSKGVPTIGSIQFVNGALITPALINSWNSRYQVIQVQNKYQELLTLTNFTINSTTPVRGIPYFSWESKQLQVSDPSKTGWYQYNTPSGLDLLSIYTIPVDSFSQFFCNIYLGCRLDAADASFFAFYQWITEIRLYSDDFKDYVVLQPFNSEMNFKNNQMNQSFSFGFTVPVISKDGFKSFNNIVPYSYISKASSSADVSQTLYVNAYNIFLTRIFSTIKPNSSSPTS